MGKRLALKQFRIGNDLSQYQISDRIGVPRAQYSSIELGRRKGSMEFWKALQNSFDIPNEKMWELMNDEKPEI